MRIGKCALSIPAILVAGMTCLAADDPVSEPDPPSAAGQVLDNGVRLPDPWPPRPAALPSGPLIPAYLADPPRVIPIDVGRQLFVDDFLIAETNLRRAYHQGRYHARSPVLRPDKTWEQRQQANTGGSAMVYSDGVFHDPRDGLFKMWYMGGYQAGTCYATSKNGLDWEKPALDVVPGTNIVLPDRRDSSTVWLDQADPDPTRRYKLFRAHNVGPAAEGWGLSVHVSADGIHWSKPVGRSGWSGDRSTVFYNPFRKVWVYSLRDGWTERPRARRYMETPDIVTFARWDKNQPPWWCGADSLDPMRDDLQVPCQLYNLDGTAYESIVLGLFTIWRGQPEFRQKPNDLVLGYSRDGWSWHRPDRRPFVTGTDRRGDWNFSNIQSAGGVCLVVGDELYFYVSGRSGATLPDGAPPAGKTGDARPNPFNRDGNCSTGLVVLRRDGFASMEGDASGGTLTTRPVRFQGRHLFVNLDAPAGELRVDLLDEQGKVLLASQPVHGDGTRLLVPVGGADGLAAFAGKPVRFRFSLRDGKLYAFWVSPDRSGASRGYVAAGGPGFTGPIDTVGNGASR